MLHAKRFICITALTLAIGAISGCMHYESSASHRGYPHSSPAHGYEYHYAPGVILSYDRTLGVYSVSGWPQHYFQGGVFWRFNDDHWHYKKKWHDKRWSRSWRPLRRPPRSLRQRHPGKRRH